MTAAMPSSRSRCAKASRSSGAAAMAHPLRRGRGRARGRERRRHRPFRQAAPQRGGGTGPRRAAVCELYVGCVCSKFRSGQKAPELQPRALGFRVCSRSLALPSSDRRVRTARCLDIPQVFASCVKYVWFQNRYLSQNRHVSNFSYTCLL